MAMYNIYNEVFQREYRAHVCSFSTIFFISVGVITFLSPLFIAYQSVGFWLRESTYREQPEVHFKNRFLLVAQGSTVSSLLAYSSFRNFNALLGENLRIVSIKSHEVDENLDGRNDYLDFQMDVPLKPTESINVIRLLFFFDYKLHKYSSLQMESLSYITYQSPLPGSAFYTDGYLQFVQKYPLPHRGAFTKFNTSIVDKEATTTGAWDLKHILSGYQRRNVSTDYIGRYPVWLTGTTEGLPFLIKGKVYYPEQTIIYRPGFWQVTKHAWIQYLAILFISLCIFDRVKKFIYENRLIEIVVTKAHLD